MNSPRHSRWLAAGRLALLGLAAGCCATQAMALEYVTLRRAGREQEVSGQVLLTAADGGLLLQSEDGTLWTIEPQELVSRRQDQEPFRPAGQEQLTRQLLAELPAGFEVHATHHYLICYNTSRQYAVWCGGLLERLHKAFFNFWSRKGMKLRDGEFPLVAVIFNSRESYAKYTLAELGKGPDSMIGYYNFRSNRVTMYDLTGVEALRRGGQRRGSVDLELILSRPEAEPLVATIIHEATHQIAFNSGLQTRLTDIPLWLSEGIAMYFETPDLGSAKGWRNVGAVNTTRLMQFRQYQQQRPPGSLEALLTDDKRFRDATSALDAYSEAWALTYYLIRHRSKQFAAYLQTLSAKKQLVWDDPATRLKEFRDAFGDPEALDADFQRQMQRVR